MRREKIKYKYLLGLWKTIPGYPKEEDVRYELENFLSKEGKAKNEISEQNMTTIFGIGWEKNDHGAIIMGMVDKGELIPLEKKPGSKKVYKLK